ncbi:UNVERIFIED_CONTAM: hypothetical protein FKN15_053700 [Acipenser sinensis]
MGASGGGAQLVKRCLGGERARSARVFSAHCAPATPVFVFALPSQRRGGSSELSLKIIGHSKLGENNKKKLATTKLKKKHR